MKWSKLQGLVSASFQEKNVSNLCEIEKLYVHNIFTIFLQQIIDGRLLLVVIVGEKNNLSVWFKFESITTNHL